MDVTCITGTHNRITLLKDMLRSARESAKGLKLNFVITDCGSDDGTIDFLKEQGDVILIERGKREGARVAFNLAAKQANGKYLVFLNDDVKVIGSTIRSAFDYLEKTENWNVGQVAFRNEGNKLAKFDYFERKLYGQCCMTRKWLGDLAGWWGEGYWTYAGDTQLGMRVLELGYKIISLDDCAIYDYVEQDNLRESSKSNRKNDADLFKSRWLGRTKNFKSIEDRLRIVKVAEKGLTGKLRTVRFKIVPNGAKPRTAIVNGLARLGKAKQINHSEKIKELGQAGFNKWAVQQMYDEQPDLIMIQAHGSDNFTVESILKIKEIVPNCVIVNFNGDVRIPLAKFNIEMAKACDLTLVASPDMFPLYNFEAASYWPITYETEFSRGKWIGGERGIFMGSNYGKTNFPDARFRRECIESISDLIDIYGSGWSNAVSSTDENHKLNATNYANSAFAVSISHFNNLYGYSSDRLYLASATGVPLIIKRFPGIENHGYDESKVILFDTKEELREKALLLLKDKELQKELGQRSKKETIENHNAYQRALNLMDLLRVNPGAGGFGTAEYIASGFKKSKIIKTDNTDKIEIRNLGADSGLVLVEYIGKSSGLFSVKGPQTKQKYSFSRSKNTSYVDTKDASLFRNNRDFKIGE